MAEKFEAMIKLEAIKTTFEHRKTPLPVRPPFFAPEIYDEKSSPALLWAAFLKKRQIETAPKNLKEVAKAIERFLADKMK